MSFRTFMDTSGVEWHAFDVVPRSDDRRHYDRRGIAERDDSLSERMRGPTRKSAQTSASDRRDTDRRITVDAGISVQKAVAGGWLCFECDGERRRLAPIPSDWMQCSDAQLGLYWRLARVVRITAAGGRQY